MFNLNKISQISKGGETMKTLVLVLALMVVVGGACVATTTATYDLYMGWSLISAPLVPINPDPLSVYAGAPDGLDYLCYRYDPSSGWVTYDSFDPSAYGNVLLGDGSSLNCMSAGATISYVGVEDGVPDGTGAMTDMWISLPGSQTDGIDAGGIHLIGQPFNHNTPVDPSGQNIGDGIFFTDGTTLKNWSEAVADSWVDGKLSTLDPANGAVDVQFDGWGGDDTLRPGKGYWLTTYKDNLALIIPAQ